MTNCSISAEMVWEYSHMGLQSGIREMSGSLGSHGKGFYSRKGKHQNMLSGGLLVAVV